MKNTLIAMLALVTASAFANTTAIPMDTVVIQLENGSKIVIYTKNRSELENIERYDINKMIRDLNQSIVSGDVDYLEMEDKNGQKYLKDTTIYYQSGDKKASITIGSLSLEVDDVEDWDDLDRKWDDLEHDWKRDDFKHYSYVDRDIKRTRNSFNIELGINDWIDDFENPPSARNEPFTARPWGSWFVGLNSTNKTWIGGPLFWEWGAGVTWYNWKMEDPYYRITKGADEVEFVLPDPLDGIDPIKSKLTATYLNITMVPVIDFARGSKKVRAWERGSFRFSHSRKDGIRIGLGGYAGYRIGSRSKYVFEENGETNKDKEKNSMYLNSLRYGARFQFGWKGVDLFINYDLNEVFSSGKGPALNAYSFGIVI